MEKIVYIKKCEICGKVFSYTNVDLKNNSDLAKQGIAHAVLGITASTGIETAIRAQSIHDRLDKIINYNKCPQCGSEKLIQFSEREYKKYLDNLKKEEMAEQCLFNIDSSIPEENLVIRMEQFVEEENWSRASQYCENILDRNPQNASAYVCRLLIEYKCNGKSSTLPIASTNSINYERIKQYGNQEQMEYINSLIQDNSYDNSHEEIDDIILNKVAKKYPFVQEKHGDILILKNQWFISDCKLHADNIARKPLSVSQVNDKLSCAKRNSILSIVAILFFIFAFSISEGKLLIRIGSVLLEFVLISLTIVHSSREAALDKALRIMKDIKKEYKSCTSQFDYLEDKTINHNKSVAERNEKKNENTQIIKDDNDIIPKVESDKRKGNRNLYIIFLIFAIVIIALIVMICVLKKKIDNEYISNDDAVDVKMEEMQFEKTLLDGKWNGPTKIVIDYQCVYLPEEDGTYKNKDIISSLVYTSNGAIATYKNKEKLEMAVYNITYKNDVLEVSSDSKDYLGICGIYYRE